MSALQEFYAVLAPELSRVAGSAPVKIVLLEPGEFLERAGELSRQIVIVDNAFLKDEQLLQKSRETPEIAFILLAKEKELAEVLSGNELHFMDIMTTGNFAEQLLELQERLESGSGELLTSSLFRVTQEFRQIGIIANSPEMAEIFLHVKKVAQSSSTVLLIGESGTGKELIAKSIHFFSKRREFNFVAVNTGAIPENLLEDELFGHVKGAFTSALKDRKGKFEHAHRGSIFLDEISTMSPGLQVKLLRVLQEREIERVGDNESVRVDVRVISATNQDLEKLVRENQFRQDLFYRLNVIPLHIPPLRQRRKDIALLANYFVKKYCHLNQFPFKTISMPALRALQECRWPGNVRQLENVIERMVVLNPDKSLLGIEELSPEVLERDPASAPASPQESFEIPEGGLSLNDLLQRIERNLILRSLEKSSYNKQKAAQLLNIKRTTLIEKMKKFQQ